MNIVFCDFLALLNHKLKPRTNVKSNDSRTYPPYTSWAAGWALNHGQNLQWDDHGRNRHERDFTLGAYLVTTEEYPRPKNRTEKNEIKVPVVVESCIGCIASVLRITDCCTPGSFNRFSAESYGTAVPNRGYFQVEWNRCLCFLWNRLKAIWASAIWFKVQTLDFHSHLLSKFCSIEAIRKKAVGFFPTWRTKTVIWVGLNGSLLVPNHWNRVISWNHFFALFFAWWL